MRSVGLVKAGVGLLQRRPRTPGTWRPCIGGLFVKNLRVSGYGGFASNPPMIEFGGGGVMFPPPLPSLELGCPRWTVLEYSPYARYACLARGQEFPVATWKGIGAWGRVWGAPCRP